MNTKFYLKQKKIQKKNLINVQRQKENKYKKLKTRSECFTKRYFNKHLKNT